MSININETENALVINPGSKMLLGYEANDFHQAIEDAITKNKKKIVIDLGNVKFISSWGIGILMYGYTTTTNSGGKFVLAAASSKIIDALKKVKLDNYYGNNPRF